MLYVEISRARDRAELVTDDEAALKEQLEALSGERLAALLVPHGYTIERLRYFTARGRVVGGLEATKRGFDARYIVTSLKGEPRHLYEGVYCARSQTENLIKQRKAQLASDRTSCQSPLANQFRLVLYTLDYWLMLALRDAAPHAALLGRVRDPTVASTCPTSRSRKSLTRDS